MLEKTPSIHMPQYAALICKSARMRLKINMKKILVAFLIAIFSSQAMAQEVSKAKEVDEFVEIIGNKIVKVAGEKATSDAKKREKIIAIIDGVIDANWIARFVLGKNYKTANDEQRQRFTALYMSPKQNFCRENPMFQSRLIFALRKKTANC